MIGNPIRHYRATGRYYTTRRQEVVGKRSDEVPFSLVAVPLSDTPQQSLTPEARLLFRIGEDSDEGGYAIPTKRNLRNLLEILVNPPEKESELVRDSVRAKGKYINPRTTDQELLDVEENRLDNTPIYVEPHYVGDKVGARIILGRASLRVTPYVDLTPRQYLDLQHTLNEYLDTWPHYRTAQTLPVVEVPVSGDPTLDLSASPDLSKNIQTNILGLRPDSSSSTTQKVSGRATSHSSSGTQP